MARSLLVAPAAEGVGLARTCLGLLRALDRRGTGMHSIHHRTRIHRDPFRMMEPMSDDRCLRGLNGTDGICA